MSSHAALHSHLFRSYIFLVAGILVFAGAALLIFQYGLKRNVSSVWRIYFSWLIMAPLVAGFILAGRIPVIVGVTLLSIFGFKEFARATGLYRDWWMTGATYIAIIAVGMASLVHDPAYYHVNGWYGLYMAMPAFAINFLLIMPVLRNRAKGQLQMVSLSILGFMYMGWMFGCLGYLANTDNAYGYLLFIIVATELNDVAAFTAGRLIGRRQLRSNISPKKTWGGALGAIAVSMAMPWLLRFSFRYFATSELILTGLIVGVGGQLGDLCISFIKRDIGIKDMGAALPGHGGILDRIDSLIFVAPLFFQMINYYHGLP